ncbi:MAG: conjugal transfer pilus assembly protein TraK [Curvibacter sp.]|nr:MAG: conjugal transfer pilus assembly protein TraK [Curvibacter sp.]
MQASDITSSRGSPSTRLWIRPVIALTFLLSMPAHALQVLEAIDGVSVEAIVSIKEPTRIRIEGAPITDVFGNIHSSHCGAPENPLTVPSASGAPASPGVTAGSGGSAASWGSAASTAINPVGDVVVECDRDKGEIYIRPTGDATKPINLFVSSASATYTLVLRRADTPADTIVIRDKTPAALRPASTSPAKPAAAGPAPNHIRAMKALLVAMATDRVPPDVRVEETFRPVQLWAEARFSLMRLYQGRGFVGEKYTLQNISAVPMVLAEQEFDRPSSATGDEIAGIAIESHNLMPGESTNVYVIRRGGAQ